MLDASESKLPNCKHSHLPEHVRRCSFTCSERMVGHSETALAGIRRVLNRISTDKSACVYEPVPDLPNVTAVATMDQQTVKNFDRITVDPAQMGGVPCVRHLRIPVATVLRLLASGLTEAAILSEYPDLQAEDIRECLRFAAASAMERELPLPYSA